MGYGVDSEVLLEVLEGLMENDPPEELKTKTEAEATSDPTPVEASVDG